jgi:septal ring factor EnvC (AmiA/AmiB activator)
MADTDERLKRIESKLEAMRKELDEWSKERERLAGQSQERNLARIEFRNKVMDEFASMQAKQDTLQNTVNVELAIKIAEMTTQLKTLVDTVFGNGREGIRDEHKQMIHEINGIKKWQKEHADVGVENKRGYYTVVTAVISLIGTIAVGVMVFLK